MTDVSDDTEISLDGPLPGTVLGSSDLYSGIEAGRRGVLWCGDEDFAVLWGFGTATPHIERGANGTARTNHHPGDEVRVRSSQPWYVHNAATE